MIFELILIFLASFVYLFLRFRRKEMSLVNEHFMITGGSSGIGLALAIEVTKKGGNVTVISRSEERLKTAKEKITSHVISSQQKIATFAADVCKDYQILSNIVHEAEIISGPITFLVNCAGTSVCHRFEETPLEEFSRMINVNYLGSVYATRAVLPLMKARKNGRITFVSSLAGLIGLYGYTAYSGSKFALMGLAEALQMEVKLFNISVTVSFPPDTDTPGFEEEMKNKPLETKLISESAGLYSPEKVAARILKDTMNKKFMSSIGFDGLMMCTLCCGASAAQSFMDLSFQVMTMGLFRVMSSIFLLTCDRTIKRCASEENENHLAGEKKKDIMPKS